MKSIQNVEICRTFDSKSWFYVYHRINGQEDIFNFVKTTNLENWNVVSISIGIQQEDIDLLRRIKKENYRIDFVTIDVAFSYTDLIIPIVDFIKKTFPNTFIICGNGASGEWIEFLERIGVDCAKVGIGVSAACRTRQYTGFGSSTVSSLIECVSVAKNIKIMSDGGITVENGETWIGDVAKAICLGADFVMSGALFSRCIDSPAIINGYYGNASRSAKGHKHVEGAKLLVETNGLTILEQIDLIEDSLKSSVSYSGGKKLSDLRKTKWSKI